MILEGLLSEQTPWGYIVDTDPIGQFEIRGLLDRKYVLRAMDGKTLFVKSFEGIAAGTRDVKLRLDAAPVHPKVAGVVTNHAGVPVAGVNVTASRTTFIIHPNPDSEFSHDESMPDDAVTDAAGHFELLNVPKEGVFLRFSGDHIIRDLTRLDGQTDVANMKIVILLRCHLKIELSGDPDAADQFAVVDARGGRLRVTTFEGNSSSSTTMGTLVHGKSGLVAVPDTAATLILLKNQTEVRRVPVQLKPGDPVIVR